MQLRATQAIVDLVALRHNIREVREHLPQGCNTLVVVKANSYGLGAVKISEMLQRNGVSYLGVAALSEAMELRNANITLPILMFTEGFVDEFTEMLRHNITQTVFSFMKAYDINVVAAALSTQSRIHLKVDTGMGRIGCTYEEAFDIASQIKRDLKCTVLEGIYTHFPVAEEPDTGDNREFTLNQIELLTKLRERMSKAGYSIPLYHCANTGGVLNYPESAFNMVRIGISAYGCHPSGQGAKLNLRNVLNFKTKVIFVKRAPKGTFISYGRHYVTEKETNIATLPVGYADGYPLALSNKGKVLIHGKAYPVAGRVCMDQMMVDLGDDPVSVGDEAVLIGTQGDSSFNLEEVARVLGTIPYEVMCRIAPRVSRIHVGLEGIDIT